MVSLNHLPHSTSVLPVTNLLIIRVWFSNTKQREQDSMDKGLGWAGLGLRLGWGWGWGQIKAYSIQKKLHALKSLNEY